MNTKVVLGAKRTCGVHEWVDQYGNHGTEVISQHQIKYYTARVNSPFDIGYEKTGTGLIDFFNSEGQSKRNVLVVMDGYLPESRKAYIDAYFVWCRKEKVIQDHMSITLTVHPTEKTVKKVSMIIKAAKQFGLKRRDYFIAIGSTTLTDIVGFAAAIYRRSTPWILVPTDIVGIIRCSVYDNNLSLDHVSHDGILYRKILAVCHAPSASFYDPRLLNPIYKDDIRRGFAEMVKMSIHMDGGLFSFVEAHVEEMFAGTGEEAAAVWGTAVDLAARAAGKDLGKALYGNNAPLSTVEFGSVAVRAIEKVRGITHGDADANCVALGIALTSALSLLKANLRSTDLGRVLNVLDKAGLPICDETLEAESLWKDLMGALQGQGGGPALVLPIVLGKAGCLNVINLSTEDIEAALSILRKHCSKVPGRSPGLDTVNYTTNVQNIDGGRDEMLRQRTVTKDVQYHVVSVPKIFSTSNPTLIHHCIDETSGRKKKVLVVVDDYPGSIIADIDVYFRRHSYAIDGFRLLSMHVSSAGKNMYSVIRVVNAAIDLRMSPRDVFVVVGGGTLMDIVGFAAAIFKGGVPYVRIPTTLVGMIDAEVGIKTGVNYQNHKSLIGRYFPPVACLNDPHFLVTLPQREFACGVAEAIKMAIVKSPRLFEVIVKSNGGYNTHTHELIRLSTLTMLEELQPNLYEHDLRRLVDFGHEFGHIIESLAKHEIPHGECVAIGMAISSFLAHLNGCLSRSDLEKILNCILSMGLPIYVADHDCCNPDILWAKIRTEGIEHKDGLLLLAVPTAIGRGGFLDEISSINLGMIGEAVLSLRWYAKWYREKKALRTNG